MNRLILFALGIVFYALTTLAWPPERAVSTDTHWYMTFTNASLLYGIDKQTGKALPPISIGVTPPPMITYRNKGFFFQNGNNYVQVINLETHKKMEPIKLGTFIDKVEVYCHLAFISNSYEKKFVIVDLRDASVLQTYKYNVKCMAFENDKAYMIIHTTTSPTHTTPHISVLDLNNFSISFTTVLYKPQKLIVKNEKAFVLGEEGRSLVVVDTEQGLTSKQISYVSSFGSLLSYREKGFIFDPHKLEVKILDLKEAEIFKTLSIDKNELGVRDIFFQGDFAYLITSAGNIAAINFNDFGKKEPSLNIKPLHVGPHSHLIKRNNILYCICTQRGDVQGYDLYRNELLYYMEGLPKGDYQVGFTGTTAYGWGCKGADLTELFTLFDAPQNEALRKILPKNIRLDRLPIVNPDDQLSLDYLYDDAVDQSAFWLCITFFQQRQLLQGRDQLEKALKQLNPYARAMMHLAYKYGLWGVEADPIYALMYKSGADEGILEADDDFLKKPK